ncbi:hypothetical protein BH20ACT7_BH20ACT7_08950 [soil metagenome]|jgi:hypothetical protein
MNNQRAFPRNTVGFGAWEAAVADAKAVGRATAQSNPRVAAADWNLIGPTNVGGRVTDVAIDVEVPGQVFIAAASAVCGRRRTPTAPTSRRGRTI